MNLHGCQDWLYKAERPQINMVMATTFCFFTFVQFASSYAAHQ